MTKNRIIGLVVAAGVMAAPLAAFATPLVAAPILTLPSGFDENAMLVNTVQSNGTATLTGLLISVGLYILARSAGGFKRGIGKIAGGRM